jgi:phosphoglucosamine mutase
MTKKLFGTDGIRGIANVYPMTVEIAMKLGRAVAYIFRKDNRRHRFVIGKDTRLSGYMYENALVAGINSMGDDVALIGPLPTPAIAFITRSLRADAGIVISASHNSYDYNGIKLFSSTGYKLPDSVEQRIEELIFSDEIDNIRPIAEGIGKAYRIDDALGRYVEYVKSSVPKGMTFDHLKIVLDCGHGAAYKVAPAAFREMGAHITVIADKPNGVNINVDCVLYILKK